MKRRSVAIMAALTALVFQMFVARASTSQTLYFHSASEVSNIDATNESQALGSGPYMDAFAPTGTTAKFATTEPAVGNNGFKKNELLAYWTANTAGVLTGSATARLWAQSVAGDTLELRLWGDGPAGVSPEIARKVIPLAATAPTEIDATFTGLSTTITSELVLQVVSMNSTAGEDTDTKIFFDSTDYPSSLTFSLDPLPAGTNPPGFANYASPIDASGFALIPVGLESSIGVNPATNATMVQNGFATLKVNFSDAATPAVATWSNVAHPATRVFTSDPILWTDQTTGRTFVLQLTGPTSIMTISDNDGTSWTVPEPPNSAPASDHETIGGGPWAIPRPATAGGATGYPHATYYCAQGVVESSCARSDDGGLTWGPPLPVNTGECGGLHGHVVVAPDGSVYVPNRNCVGRQGVYVSHDNGLNWSLIKIPAPIVPANSDPKVAFDKASRLYFAASSGTSSSRKAMVTTLPSGSSTWTPAVDIGASLGIKNAEQPAIIAGDAGRAAAFFYGTTTAGNDQETTFTGIWHAYVAFTYDSGATWSLVDLTPTDPVQRGTICMAGTSCASGRNLLDFQDMTVDAQGRVLVSYADGCASPACVAGSGTSADSVDQLLTVARQTTGNRLYAAFD
ncbi:MAG: sialidase family protein [Actinomycetota bacterium]